jgi:hypothetical protein
VKYIIRLNPRAYNPVTRTITKSRLWEVEQCATRDSDKCIWHAADIKVDGRHVREFFQLPKDGEPAWEYTCYGIAVRGQDNAIELKTGPQDASGN